MTSNAITFTSIFEKKKKIDSFKKIQKGSKIQMAHKINTSKISTSIY
jgi:hypothetical protein